MREAVRRGLDQQNTNYGHSLSLTERFINHPAFTDVLNHFTTLHPQMSTTTPCSGTGYHGTKHGFTILESLAFFLFHHFQLHLDAGFLKELPESVLNIVTAAQLRLEQGIHAPAAFEVLKSNNNTHTLGNYLVR
jgi:hypothetical protein